EIMDFAYVLHGRRLPGAESPRYCDPSAWVCRGIAVLRRRGPSDGARGFCLCSSIGAGTPTRQSPPHSDPTPAKKASSLPVFHLAPGTPARQSPQHSDPTRPKSVVFACLPFGAGKP